MKFKASSEKHFYGWGQSRTYTVVFQDGSSVAVQGTNPSFSHKKTFGFLSPKKLYQDSWIHVKVVMSKWRNENRWCCQAGTVWNPRNSWTRVVRVNLVEYSCSIPHQYHFDSRLFGDVCNGGISARKKTERFCLLPLICYFFQTIEFMWHRNRWIWRYFIWFLRRIRKWRAWVRQNFNWRTWSDIWQEWKKAKGKQVKTDYLLIHSS